MEGVRERSPQDFGGEGLRVFVSRFPQTVCVKADGSDPWRTSDNIVGECRTTARSCAGLWRGVAWRGLWRGVACGLCRRLWHGMACGMACVVRWPVACVVACVVGRALACVACGLWHALADHAHNVAGQNIIGRWHAGQKKSPPSFLGGEILPVCSIGQCATC